MSRNVDERKMRAFRQPAIGHPPLCEIQIHWLRFEEGRCGCGEVPILRPFESVPGGGGLSYLRTTHCGGTGATNRSRGVQELVDRRSAHGPRSVVAGTISYEPDAQVSTFSGSCNRLH